MGVTVWKRSAVGLAMLAGVITASAQDKVDVVDRPETNLPNIHYAGNRAPLMPSAFIPLPFGAIKPQGWIRKQLELQAEGFTGKLTEISSFCNPKNNAWLSPKGEGSNGWEEVPYWLRGFVPMGLLLDDEKIIQESKPWIEAMLASQTADGYFGPRSNYKERGDHDMMPNMFAMFALRAYYEYTEDPRVIELLKKYFKWQLQVPDNKFFSGGWQVPRNGDNMDSVYWLYNRTGDPELLELAAKLQRTGATWMKIVNAGHNVDFSQGFRKPGQFYPQSKDPKFLQTSEQQWDSIISLYGQVPGGAFGGDEFARTGYGDPRQAIETCGAVEQIISHQILFRVSGDTRWVDRCENVAFNTLPATTTADLKALRYLSSPNQVNSDARSKTPGLANGGPMQVMNPHDHRCCQHNFGAGWPYFAQGLWMATPGNGVAAVMYGASTVMVKVADTPGPHGRGVKVSITEETNYPFDGTVSFLVNPMGKVQFPFYLRIPDWCPSVQLAINGKPVAVQARPGAFIRILRTWQTGDEVTLQFPMDLRLKRWEKNQNSVSVNRGPLTFSVKIGEKAVPYQPTRFKDPWPAFELVPTTPWNYGLAVDPANPAASLKVVTRPWPKNNMPFTHEGTPVEIQARAHKIPNWQEDHLGLVDKLQPSPVKVATPAETITLIPMGAGRLRLAALPVIGTGPDAREWQLPPEPLASYTRGNDDPYEAMFDGRVPEKSDDSRMPRFTTYSFGGAEHGKLHWVMRKFDAPLTVDACEVFWYDEASRKGDVRLPESWRVLYKDGEAWKPVETTDAYGIAPDRFNTVKFKPVKTTALKLEVQTQREKGRFAMGIHEWRIPGVPPMEPKKK